MPPVTEEPRQKRVALAPHYDVARFLPETYDEEHGTIEIVAGTGAGVLRRDYDGPYVEILGMKSKEVRLGRFGNGRAPLLDSHDRGTGDFFTAGGGVRSGVILGVIEESKLRKSDSPDAPDGMELWCRVRLSRRPELESVRMDIRDGIITNASLGYRVFAFTETKPGEDGAPRIFRATDWEPFELSLLAVGADVDAGTRSYERAPDLTHECTFHHLQSERTMPPEDDPKPETNPNTPSGGGTRTAPEPNDEAVRAAREAGAKAERERQIAIRKAVDGGVRAGLSEDAAEKLRAQLLEDPKGSAERARELVLEALARRDEDDEVAGNHTAQTRTIAEERDKLRAAVENALEHRTQARDAEGRVVALTDGGREIRGMSLIRIAEEMLMRAGVNTRGLTKMQIARRAFSRGVGPGLHGTSDFPLIVANVANKNLQRAYQAQERTFLPWTSRNDLPDFKPVSVVQISGVSSLEKVNAQGEIRKGTVGEKGESWFLSTYGIRVGFTRQMVVNDDLSALRRIPAGFGADAASQENDLVYAMVTGNVVLAEDSTALFHADHGNLSGGALGIPGLQAMDILARKQKNLAGRHMNVMLKHLVVPAALGVTASQLVTQTSPSTVSEVNPFRGQWDSISVEPRLDVDSATAYYGAANPDQVDTFQYGYLQGEGEGPRVEEMDSWEVDGMEFRCLHDFGVGAIDYRGLYKSSGT